MNNSVSLQQIQKTSNLDANLISRQYKLNLMADFMRVKYENPRIKQTEIANQLGMSSSTLQRYRNDVNMFSPYRINPNNIKKQSKKVKNNDFNNNSNHEEGSKRFRMTSNDFKRPQTTSNESGKKSKTRNSLKGGLVLDDIEINEHYLDKVLKKNNH